MIGTYFHTLTTERFEVYYEKKELFWRYLESETKMGLKPFVTKEAQIKSLLAYKLIVKM